MTGREEQENKTKGKIKNLLLNNDDSLTGYYNFISSNTSVSSQYQYLTYVSKFLKHIGKDSSKLMPDDFINYIANIYNTKSSSYSIATYSALNRYGEYLKVSMRLNYNPMEMVKRPKAVESLTTLKKREQGYLSSDEIKMLKNSVNKGSGSSRAINYQKNFKNRDLLIVSLLLTTGIRCSALTSINIDDVDLTKMTLQVVDKGSKIKEYRLSENIKEYFEQYFIERNKILGDAQIDALFVSSQKKRLCQAAVSNITKKYSRSFTNKNITAHKLRATYGTQLYDATHDIYFVQQAMHHNSPKTTELYIRGQKDNNQKASDIMSKLL